LPGDGASRRRDRIAEIARSVQSALFQAKPLDWVPLKELVATISIQTGLVPSRILQYLALLNDAGMFELDVDEGKIKKVVLVDEQGVLKNESEVSGEQS
jgi:hypothetical protein